MVIMFFVTTIPFLVISPGLSFQESINNTQSVFHQQAVNCSQNYAGYNEEIKALKSAFEQVLDFLQGTVSLYCYYELMHPNVLNP